MREFAPGFLHTQITNIVKEGSSSPAPSKRARQKETTPYTKTGPSATRPTCGRRKLHGKVRVVRGKTEGVGTVPRAKAKKPDGIVK